MLFDLPKEIIDEIIDYLEKPKMRKLSPPGYFAVVGPPWGKCRIKDTSLFMIRCTNRELYYTSLQSRFRILEPYSSKWRLYEKYRSKKINVFKK